MQINNVLNSTISLCFIIACTFQASGQLDTISLPGMDLDDESMLAFYQPYKSIAEIDIKFTSCSAPNNYGDDWNTIVSDGSLQWDSNKEHLQGSCKIRYNSETKLEGSIISELFDDQSKYIELKVNTSNGDLSVIDEAGEQVYKTKITNHIVHGFNNSNRIVILTLMDH